MPLFKLNDSACDRTFLCPYLSSTTQHVTDAFMKQPSCHLNFESRRVLQRC
jgi:hypothetical protein